MTTDTNNTGIEHGIGGLELKEPDVRDFSLSGVFGAADIADVPTVEWITGTAFIKNQYNTDLCTGMGLAAVLEDTEDVELSPEWLFAQIKKLRGDPLGYGGDLNTGCKVACKLGAIEKVDAPFDVDTKDRNFLAYASNWPKGLATSALDHRAQSSFKVDGPHDTFDNIRAALWKNRMEKRSIYTGCMWRPGWSGVRDGVIPNRVIAGGTGHCFKIRNGQKIINGVPHLIIQNSAGTGAGDGGFYYMSRPVANRELVFGAYMFVDMPPAEAKAILKPAGLLVETNSLWERVVNWYKQLIH